MAKKADKATWQDYAVITGDGSGKRDPLPRIGNGLRIIRAKVARKWVYLRYHGEPAGRVTTRVWRDRVSSVPYTGQPLGDVLAALRG